MIGWRLSFFSIGKTAFRMTKFGVGTLRPPDRRGGGERETDPYAAS